MPKKVARKALTARQIRALPAVVGLETAADAFGIGRSLAYKLAKDDVFPCPLLPVGRCYRVRRADIMAKLHIEELPERETAADPAA